VRLYTSYVVRCWSNGRDEPRVEVVNIQSQERVRIASWADAFQWIQEQEGARHRAEIEPETAGAQIYAEVVDTPPRSSRARPDSSS
jgi:hypothetical protein